MEKSGLKTLDLISCEGIISFIDEEINTLTGEKWEAWVNINYTLGRDSCIHGAAEHLLYIGKKQ